MKNAYNILQVIDNANEAYKKGYDLGLKNKELSDYLFKAANLVNDVYLAGLKEGGKVAIEGIGKKHEKEGKEDE